MSPGWEPDLWGGIACVIVLGVFPAVIAAFFWLLNKED